MTGVFMQTVTYATLINQKIFLPSPRTNYIAVDRDHLVVIMKPILSQIYVDSDWYLKINPDIQTAIEAGKVESAEAHYVGWGFYEHRMPYEIVVDESWYQEQYPDIREAIAKSLFASGREHFYLAGFKEGRLPHANFALAQKA